MYEDCELCYSCHYCKPIRQMAAPYTLFDWTYLRVIISHIVDLLVTTILITCNAGSATSSKCLSIDLLADFFMESCCIGRDLTWNWKVDKKRCSDHIKTTLKKCHISFSDLEAYVTDKDVWGSICEYTPFRVTWLQPQTLNDSAGISLTTVSTYTGPLCGRICASAFGLRSYLRKNTIDRKLKLAQERSNYAYKRLGYSPPSSSVVAVEHC